MGMIIYGTKVFTKFKGYLGKERNVHVVTKHIKNHMLNLQHGFI